MNGPFVHLTLNHVPIIGVFFVLTLLALGWVRRSEELADTSFLALVVLALIAIGVYFSGEAAEEAIEHLAGVSETRIEAHEEAALVAFIGMETLGAAALAAFLVRRRIGTIRAWIGGVALLAVVVAGLFVWTAHRGGLIRHPELRGADAPAAQLEAEAEDDRTRGGRR